MKNPIPDTKPTPVHSEDDNSDDEVDTDGNWPNWDRDSIASEISYIEESEGIPFASDFQ